MKTATFVKQLEGWQGDARLYHLSEPMVAEEAPTKETSYVIVSAVDAYSGPETYIFPATAVGECLGFGELDGSFQGELSHEKALLNAGYKIEPTLDTP